MGLLISSFWRITRRYWVTMRDLWNVEYFSWNDWHSQFLSNSIWKIITTIRIVLKIFDLCVRLRVTHTVNTKMLLQVCILNGRIGVMMCLVVKLMVESVVRLSFVGVIDALWLVKHCDYLLYFGFVNYILFLVYYSLYAISKRLQWCLILLDNGWSKCILNWFCNL